MDIDMTQPATCALVNRCLKAMGKEERLYAGRDYYYFRHGNTGSWGSTSIYVYRIKQLTLGQVLSEYEQLSQDC